MKQLILSILSDLYPTYMQGSAPSVLPDSYFTIWETSEDAAHYNNKAVSYAWSYDVNFYSKSPSLTNTVLLAAKALLKKSGFIVGGKGRDITTDDPLYTARSITAEFLETEFPEEPEENEEEGG